MWRHHFPKLKITNPTENLVSSNVRLSNNLAFYNVRQRSSFCNRASLNFRVNLCVAWHQMAVREGFCEGQKMSHRVRFLLTE